MVWIMPRREEISVRSIFWKSDCPLRVDIGTFNPFVIKLLKLYQNQGCIGVEKLPIFDALQIRHNLF